MKRILLITVMMTLCVIISNAQLKRECAAHTIHEEKMVNDPVYRLNREKIEANYQKFMQRGTTNAATGIRTIPVYVHVIYNTAQENISDAQIQSQIAVLNEDFSATNLDISGVPTEFSSSIADYGIVFEIAAITRKSSTRTSWGTNDDMKKSSLGGVDPITPDTHLNMWVCEIGGGILGYAQFPGGNPATDGVVMGPQYFGSSDYGSFYLSSPFDKGRTATHEIGHYLNLRHIWGDGNCTVDDFVSDTPTAKAANYGCPTYPNKSCNNNGGFTSDMFMNFMDYTNDACMFMFTSGQLSRSASIFASGGSRENLGTVGGGCSLTAPTGLASSSINDNGFTLTWNTVSGADSYDVSIDGTVTNLIGTSYVATGLASGTSYTAKVRANCIEGNGAYSADFIVTTTGSAPVTYCASNGNSTADEYIGRVQLGSIDNSTGAGTGGYADYTALSTDLALSSSNTITITPTWTGTIFDEGYSVWIDYNKNGLFTDAGEQVWSAAPSKTTPVGGSFVVPSSANIGSTRMRVSLKYNGTPTSCESFSYGEVEDYTVNIVGVGEDTQAPTVPTGLSVSGTTETTTSLLWTASSDNIGVTGYDVYVDGFLDGSTATTSYNISGLVVNTSYTLSVSAKDAAGNTSAQSTGLNITTPDLTAPTAVTGLAAANTTETSTDLSWTAATDNVGVSGYEVYVDGFLNGSTVLTSYSVTGLSASSTYTLSVRAKDAAGNASTSSAVNVTTSDPVGGGCSDVTLTLIVDNYPEETSWTITDDVATVVASGGLYTTTADGATVIETACLEDGCYTFTINDTYGDGICCLYGNGSYVLKDELGTVLASGGSFASSQATNFCLIDGAAARTTRLENNNFEMNPSSLFYPNPVKSYLNINVPKGMESMNVYTTNGVEIHNVSIFSDGIDVSQLKAGIYMVIIKTEKGTIRDKFIKE
ncbi:MAG: GEVED domain-containing protein [Cyclobacteriaceae bacterium]|nr:GEVED domain-containing protein [Cyclobacteriaceae bacterium]